MNNNFLIKEISKLTKDWSFEYWRLFRKQNDYWKVKDAMHKRWFNSKSGKWNNQAYTNWLSWKLMQIKEDSY